MKNKIKIIALIIFLLTGTILSAKDEKGIAGQSFAYIPDQSANTVSVIDIDTLTIVKTISVGNNPFGVAATQDGRLIYISNTDDDSISVIDGKTQTVIETIAVGEGPRGIAVSLDQETVVTANTQSNTISVLYTKDNLVITQPMGNGFIQYGPTEVGFYFDDHAWVRNETEVSMSRIFLSRNHISSTTQIFDANSSFSYGFDLKGFIHFPTSPVSRRALVASPDENKLLFVNQPNGIESQAALDNINSPSDMVLSKDGDKAFVASDNPGSISILTVALNQSPPITLDSTIANINNAKEIGLNADETRLVIYSASANEKKITTINTQTNQVIGSVNLPLSSHVLGDFVSTTPSNTVSSVIFNSQYNFPDPASIAVIDLETNQDYLQIPLSAVECCNQSLENHAQIVIGINPNERKVFSADGRYIYTSRVRGTFGSERDNTVAVFDRILNEEIALIDLGPFGDFPNGIAVSPNGDFVYTINILSDTISVIQTSDNTLIDTVAIGPGPGVSPASNIQSVIEVSSDGTKLYLASPHSDIFIQENALLIYDISNKMIEQIIPLYVLPDLYGNTYDRLFNEINLFSLSQEGSTLYIGGSMSGNGATIVAVDLLTNTVTQNIKTLGSSIKHMSLSSDGKRLAAFSTDSVFGDIAVIDLSTNKVIRYLTSESPSGLGGFVADTPPMADFVVNVTNGLDVLPPNATVTYQITIDNNGPDSVNGAIVTSIVPNGLTLIGWTCSGSGNCINNSGNTNIIESVDLAAGEQIVFEVTATVQIPEIIIDFSASVQMPNDVLELLPFNNTANDSDSIGVFASGFE